ncbi:hypothetical protein MMC10_005755 [Thelotrema lepadinum]|nr:hypothetical protein [Thelotrema lepadinum]
MKLSSILALASTALAAPLAPRQSGITDVDILQFALTLEHLENVFYKSVFQVFSLEEFMSAGYTESFFLNVGFIAQDEETHVALLEKAISAAGATPVAPCNYQFPITDVRSFVGLSNILEGVGSSAYLGAAPLVQDKANLAVAGSILVTEALHTALQRQGSNLAPAANAFGTGLGANEVFTLAAAFITSCPSSNSPLPFKAFPTLTASTSNAYLAGTTVSFSTQATWSSGSSVFMTFINGLTVVSVPMAGGNTNGTAQMPSSISGQTYVLMTNSAVTSAVNDSQVIAGPAVIEVSPAAPVLNDTLLRV